MLESSYRQKKAEYEERLKLSIMVLDIFGKNLLDKAAASLGTENIRYSLTEYFPELFDFAQSSEYRKEEKGKDTVSTLSSEMKIYKAKRVHDAFLRNQRRNEKE